MAFYSEFLDQLDNQEHRMVLEKVLDWVSETYPQLGGKIAWKQPKFTDHGTFIIGFSVAKNNFAFTPESVTISKFETQIEKTGYTHTPNIVRVPFDAKIDYELIGKMIEFNIEDKKDYSNFFRK